jgi:putative ABC transport system substrate-binding protein
MRRRHIVGLMATWPLAVQAQPARLPIVGFLGAGSHAAWAPLVMGFEKRLSELGWIDGRTCTIAYRWADGKLDRFTEIATEFVRLKVNVIVTAGSAVAAVMQATSTIPVVFASAVDPVASGLVASLSRPGGNVTGLSLQSTDITGKRIELLRQVVPGLARLAVLANVGYPAAARESSEIQAIARQLGLAVDALDIRSSGNIASAIDTLRGKTQALYLCTDALVVANVASINGVAREAGVATMWGSREYCEVGGFISYGANTADLFRRSGDYVDKILKGAKPADLPVEQPTKFELIINMKTAKALGLTIPPSILARADEMIE